ncbi:MAG: hypothetical protein FWG25_08090 [Promicromonosporaceae bacterium]|nr:hypothetical protein [Promicromonosporaceae bacterium]
MPFPKPTRLPLGVLTGLAAGSLALAGVGWLPGQLGDSAALWSEARTIEMPVAKFAISPAALMAPDDAELETDELIDDATLDDDALDDASWHDDESAPDAAEGSPSAPESTEPPVTEPVPPESEESTIADAPVIVVPDAPTEAPVVIVVPEEKPAPEEANA